MKSSSAVKLSSSLALAALVVGCAGPQATAPAGTPISALTADRLTLRGLASPSLENPSCSAAPAPKPSHVLRIEEDTHATVLLQPAAGEAPLPPTMLHLTHLASNRTWCVMTQPDGTPAVLGGEFPSGDYSVSVAEVVGAAPRRYEVRVQRL